MNSSFPWTGTKQHLPSPAPSISRETPVPS
jgi:hypothetical protein